MEGDLLDITDGEGIVTDLRHGGGDGDCGDAALPERIGANVRDGIRQTDLGQGIGVFKYICAQCGQVLLKRNTGKGCAVGKRPIANGTHTGWDGDFGEACVIKCFCADLLQGIRQGRMNQTACRVKGLIGKDGDPDGKGDACQSALGKGTPSNVGQSGGKGKAGQTAAFFKGTFPNGPQRVRQRYTGQCVGTLKRSLWDFSHRFRQHNAAQLIAVVKGPLSKDGEAAQIYIRQLIAVGKGVCRNIGHTLCILDMLQLIAIFKCGFRNGRCALRQSNTGHVTFPEYRSDVGHPFRRHKISQLAMAEQSAAQLRVFTQERGLLQTAVIPGVVPDLRYAGRHGHLFHPTAAEGVFSDYSESSRQLDFLYLGDPEGA